MVHGIFRRIRSSESPKQELLMPLAKNFGAVGAGITDDTDALQHTVDDGDGVWELSKGTYRVTRSVVLDSRKYGYS